MIVSYLVTNFMTLMIIVALLTMIFVNRDVKIPATNLFVLCVFIVLSITIIGAGDVHTDVSGLAPDDAARVVQFRTVCATLGYILRPCVILTELLIILRGIKHRMLCIIPAFVNAVIYSTALFGSRIAFYIDESNSWGGGPLRFTVYVTQFLYLLILLYISIHSFYSGDRRKSLILIVIFLQALLVAALEYNSISEFTDPITALCVLEYYIYLSTVYRQELNNKLDDYVIEIGEAGLRLKTLTQEVMEALANAIDAKDPYTNGHSIRVAEYSRNIAAAAGKGDEECENIFYAALLHDVGKIGVPKSILSKTSRLTDYEFEQIKQHTITGSQILSNISEIPWLSIGAHYHHERYNGKGYPEGLKGEEIPEIARIIAVADAYDAMTSNRSYRNAIPQHIVREELAKGIGTQFDPEFAKIMIHMIDLDSEYRMKESISGANVSAAAGLRCESIYNGCTKGINITKKKAVIRLCSQPDDDVPADRSLPTIIVFDALDGEVHPGEENNKDLLYFEYARIRLDGCLTEYNVRKGEVRICEGETDIEQQGLGDTEFGQKYKIEAVRNRDHLLMHISNENQMFDVILALPDAARYVFISISGENCEIHNIKVDTEEKDTDPSYIPRIADEICYTKGCPEGDIPNIEVDGPRLATTKGIPISDSMTLSFHSMSYPTARLVWHCPYLCLFSSANGEADGSDFHEYLLLKLDGENWESHEKVDNLVEVAHTDAFTNWNAWMEQNKNGLDCEVSIRKEDNKIIMHTEYGGLAINSTTTLQEGKNDVCVALTGDQCAITDIRIRRDNE